MLAQVYIKLIHRRDNSMQDDEKEGKKESTIMKTMGTVIRWIGMQCLFGWCAWEALYRESIGAGRFLIALAWISCMWTWLVVVAYVVKEDEGKTKEKSKRVIPGWLRVPPRLALIGCLVWFGWWWTSIAFCATSFGWLIICHEDEPDTEKTEDPKKKCAHCHELIGDLLVTGYSTGEDVYFCSYKCIAEFTR